MDGCAPRKRFWKWIWEDVIVACFVAAGLDVLIKTEWPKLLKVLSEMTGSHLKEQVENDKRAEMVREFRRMKDAGININNIIRRHALAMKKSKPVPEWKFVQLLCKIPPPDPTDPSAVRPPVVPGKRGVPQNERQADLKWLNNMSDKEFNQMLYFLDHDVVRQWGGRLGERIERITSALRSRCGRAGRAIATVMGAIADATLHFLESIGRSPLRLIATGIVLLPIALFTAIIISPIRRRVFPWFGIANGVLLVTVAYWLLVPTSSDKTLWSAWLLLLAAAFFLWKFAWVRNTIFGFLVLFTLIFFLGGRTVAWSRGVKIYDTHVQAAEQRTANQQAQQKIAELQAKAALQEEELAHLRLKKISEDSKTPPLGPAQGQDKSDTQQSLEQPGGIPQIATPPASATPPPPLASYYPLSGDKGNVIPIMNDCYYFSGEVIKCEGVLVNTDPNDNLKHGIYLMDSQGIVTTLDGRGEQFAVWTFGGSLQFSGGGDFTQVIPRMPSSFVFSFSEKSGRAKWVGITLYIKTLPDSNNHPYVFANIPVFDHRP